MSVMKRERRPMELSWPEDRIDRVFRDMFRDFFTRGIAMDRFFEGWPNPMHVEEFAEGDTWVIRAELPGIDPDKDVDIDVSDGVLHVQARREERKEEERPSGYHSEFHYGTFQRSIRLPEGATEADVKATYEDGILEVRVPVPKAEAKTPTKVPIEHS
jgi:HSP20 family protein